MPTSAKLNDRIGAYIDAAVGFCLMQSKVMRACMGHQI